MTNNFGGKWVVFICEKDEICSFSGVPGKLEYLMGWYGQAYWSIAKGQLISECLFEKIVWTKIPTKNLIDSAQQV